LFYESKGLLKTKGVESVHGNNNIMNAEQSAKKVGSSFIGTITSGLKSIFGGGGGASTLGAFGSGLIGAATSVIGVLSGFITSAFKRVESLVATVAHDLAELAIEGKNIGPEIGKALGFSPRVDFEKMVHEFAEQFGKEISESDIQEGVIGLSKSFGDITGLQSVAIKNQIEFNKWFNISGEEAGKFVKVLSSGKFGTLNQFQKTISTISKGAFVSEKLVMQDIVRNTSWIAYTTAPKMVQEFAKISAHLRSMGLSVDVMTKASDNMKDFGSATEKVFQLNASLGTAIDPLVLNTFAMTHNLKGFVAYLEKAVGSLNSLNPMQIDAFANAFGMGADEIQNFIGGANLVKQMGNSSSEIQKISGAFLTDDIKKSIVGRGLGDKNEQGKDIGTVSETFTSAVQTVFQQNRSLFGSVEKMISVLQNPTKDNAVLVAQISEQIQSTLSGVKAVPENGTLEQKIASFLTNEDIVFKKQIQDDLGMKKAVTDLSTLQDIANQLLAMILAATVKFGGIVASAIAKAFDMPITAGAIKEISGGISEGIKKIQESSHERLVGLDLINQKLEDSITKEINEKFGSFDKVISSLTTGAINLGVGIVQQLIENGPKIGEAIAQGILVGIPSAMTHGAMNAAADAFMPKNMDAKTKDAAKTGIWEGLKHFHGYAVGGMIHGDGGPKEDRVPIHASAGEFIVNADSTKRNRGLLEHINRYATGGVVLPGTMVDDDGNIIQSLLQENDASSKVYNEHLIEKTKKREKSRLADRLISRQTTNASIQNGGFFDVNHKERENLALEGSAIGQMRNGLTKSQFEDTINGYVSQMKISNPEMSEDDMLNAAIGQGGISRDAVSKKIGKGILTGLVAAPIAAGTLPLLVGGSGFASVLTNSVAGFGIHEAAKHIAKHNDYLDADVMSNLLNASEIASLGKNLIGHGGHIIPHLNMKTLLKLGQHEGGGIERFFGKELTHGVKTVLKHEFGDKIGESFIEKSSEGMNSKNIGSRIPSVIDSDATRVSSNANGTMVGGVPGFINTSDYDALRLHQNEHVQVMNSGQKIERDLSMDKQTEAIMTQAQAINDLIKAMTDGSSNNNFNISLNIDGEQLQKVVISAIRKSMEA